MGPGQIWVLYLWLIGQIAPGLHFNRLVGILLGMKLGRVIQTLQALAPVHLAEPWDQVGLHVGDSQQAVGRALLCIDLTEPVLEDLGYGLDLEKCAVTGAQTEIGRASCRERV